MTRQQAIKLLGSAEALRKYLGLETVQGVYMMPANKPMPAKHILRMQKWGKRKWTNLPA